MRGSLRKRSRSSWTLEVSAGFDVSGKRRRITRTVHGTKREAEAELARLVMEISTGTELDPGRVTVDAYLTRWLEHARTRVRPTTWNRYESLLRVHARPLIGNLQLSRVRPAHVQQVVDAMVAAGAAPRSVVQCYRVLSASMRQAVRWRLLAVNPALAASPPRPSRPVLDVPSVEALRHLLSEASGSPYGPAITVVVGTGVRRGELLGLRWPEVDLAGARLRVTASLQRHRTPDGSRLVLVEPKTPRARREIALPSFAVEALRAHRKEQAERRLRAGEAWYDAGLVFDNGLGSPIDPDTFTHAYRRVAERAGLKGVRLHDIRHAFATLLLSRGTPPLVASQALGHASTGFTQDVYAEVLPHMQTAAAATIDEALQGKQDRPEELTAD